MGYPYGPNAPGYYSLLRLNTDGTLDSTYHYRKTNGVIWTIEPTTQGRFLLSGVYRNGRRFCRGCWSFPIPDKMCCMWKPDRRALCTYACWTVWGGR